MPTLDRPRPAASALFVVGALLSLFFAPVAGAATCITATVPLTGASDAIRTPVALAWTGSSLALVKGDGAGNLWVGLYTESLAPVGDDAFLAAGWDGRGVKALTAASELAVFYRGVNGNLSHVTWNPETGSVGGAGALFPTRAPTLNRAFDVESSGNFFVVAETTTARPSTGVWVNRLDLDGRVIAEAFQFLPIPSSAWVDVEITDSTVLVAANDELGLIRSTSVFWTTHDVDRMRAGTDRIDGVNTRMAWNGESVFAVAVEPSIDPNQTLRQAVLSPTGVLLSGPAPFLPDASIAAPGDLLWNGQEFLFTWMERSPTSAVRLVRLGADRAIVTETGFVSDRLRRSYPPATKLVWTGASAVAAFSRIATGGAIESHLASHCPLSVSIEGPVLILAGTEATWTAQVMGGLAPWSYAWQMGGSSFGSATTMTRRLSNPGTFTIRLTASDRLGAQVLATLDVEVVTSLPELAVEIEGPTSLRPGEAGTFEAAATGAVGEVQFAWTFGDGRATTGRSVEAGWPTPGRYTVTLTVTDEAGRSRSAQLEVTIEPARRRAASRS